MLTGIVSGTSRSSNNKVSITTLQCICANGNALPPSILFPEVNFNPEYSVGYPDNLNLGFTKSGWIEMEQFYAWMTNHFVTQIPPCHLFWFYWMDTHHI